jgi:uncharacterized LabA/DUF88 family protein
MQRVITYIDGYNLYYGLRSKGWQGFYWLNLRMLSLNLLKSWQTLVMTKYFTTKVDGPPAKQKRQNTYLEALETLPDFTITYGQYLAERITCRNCGHTYTTYHEKMTDVNIAMALIADAFDDKFDTALLISADSDLVGPIKRVKARFSHKRIVVVFPPKRHSSALNKAADACLHLSSSILAKSVFPDEVIKPDNFILRRPTNWR